MKKLALLAAAIFLLPSMAFAATYYKNVNGVSVHSPVHVPVVPVGATAQCKDGSYSFSLHRSGTCSGHRGVAKWLR
jgi:hypothetical protein